MEVVEYLGVCRQMGGYYARRSDTIFWRNITTELTANRDYDMRRHRHILHFMIIMIVDKAYDDNVDDDEAEEMSALKRKIQMNSSVVYNTR